jgi:hypothetical protein
MLILLCRPFLNALVVAMLAASQLYLSFMTSRVWLFVGIVAVGFSYGGLWAMYVFLTSLHVHQPAEIIQLDFLCCLVNSMVTSIGV